MRTLLGKVTALAILTLLVASASFAQGQQGGAFSQFREQHKYTFQLMQMVRHTGDIDKDAKHSLSPAQAKQVLAVLKPLRTRPKLTQDQAKQALKDLKKIFTVDQLNAMARIKPRPQSGQRMGNGGPGGPGGPGGAHGGRPGGMRMDPNAMKDFNPFYAKASASDPRAAERSKRWDSFIKGLEQKSHQAKSAPVKSKARK